jgi:hypothetical protein
MAQEVEQKILFLMNMKDNFLYFKKFSGTGD